MSQNRRTTNGLGAEIGYSVLPYTGPGTLAGRYMRTFWQPVYVSRDLPAGRAKPIKIMGEDLTLYRGDSGDPHLLAFRCAHRGTQLSTGWVEGDRLRCFYHGWTYGPDGQCVEQPAEPEPFCQRIRIRSYPVQEYLGLLFAYLGEGEPPELPRYPELEEEGILLSTSGVRACNYFNVLDNVMDHTHTPFVHRRAGHDTLGGLTEIPEISVKETEWGVTLHGKRSGGRVRVNHAGMPNILYLTTGVPDQLGGGWSPLIIWTLPIDDEQNVSFRVQFVRLTGDAARSYFERHTASQKKPWTPARDLAAAVLRGELRTQDVDADHPDLVNFQDDVAQGGQGVIADRDYEHLGRADVGVVLLRNLWLRELRKLAQGEPLTRWVRTDRIAQDRSVEWALPEGYWRRSDVASEAPVARQA